MLATVLASQIFALIDEIQRFAVYGCAIGITAQYLWILNAGLRNSRRELDFRGQNFCQPSGQCAVEKRKFFQACAIIFCAIIGRGYLRGSQIFLGLRDHTQAPEIPSHYGVPM
jgi:hypothetical protein